MSLGGTYPKGETRAERVLRCEAQASRIAAHRLSRAGGRVQYGKAMDNKSRNRSGLTSTYDPDVFGLPEKEQKLTMGGGVKESTKVGGWMKDQFKPGTSVDYQEFFFGEDAADAGKADFPWEFGKVGTPSSDVIGGWAHKIDERKKAKATGSKKDLTDFALHGEGHDETTEVKHKVHHFHADKRSDTKQGAYAEYRSRIKPEKLVSQWNKAQFEVEIREEDIKRDFKDHFEGATMLMAEGSEDTKNHGCKIVGEATLDHFHGMLIDHDAPDVDNEHGGRKHIASMEADHFVGQSMDLDGRGDIDLENASRSVAAVNSEGTSAQSSHMHGGGVSMNEDAGGEGLFNTAGIISEMKHLGRSKDVTKQSSYDHFGSGAGATINEDAEEISIISAHKGNAAATITHSSQDDHFDGGSMAMDLTKDAVHRSLTKHVGAHGDAEHSFDHFVDGGMALDGTGEFDIASAAGAAMQHVGHVAGHDRSEDHFQGMEMDNSGQGVRLTAFDGTELRGMKHDSTAKAAGSHFGDGGFILDETADDGLVADGGFVLKSIAHAGAHGAAEHSYDHFSGGMVMGAEGTTETGLFSVGGAALGHEKHHHYIVDERGVVDQRSEDHFSLGGMGLSVDSEDVGLMSAQGAVSSHHGHAGGIKKSGHAGEDHFDGAGFSVADGHGHISKSDAKRLNKNKHFKSFYT